MTSYKDLTALIYRLMSLCNEFSPREEFDWRMVRHFI